MSEMETIQKIVEAYNSNPKKCPYCFRRLKTKLLKFCDVVNFYCPICEQTIDLDWDYLHAIAEKCQKYSILKDDSSSFDFRKVVEE